MTRQTISQRRALADYERCQRAHASAPPGRKLHWWYRMRDAMTALLDAVAAARRARDGAGR